MDRYESQPTEDGRDIFELVEAIWHERNLIITAILFSLAAGLTFIYSSPARYQASIKIGNLPPSTSDSLTNISFHEKLITTSPLNDFIRILNSTSFYKLFIDTTEKDTGTLIFGTGSEYEKINRLNQLFKYKEAKPYNKEQTNKKLPYAYKLTFEASSPLAAAKMLDRLVSTAEQYQLNQYLDQFSSIKQNTLEALNNQRIELERAAQNSRINRIIAINEKQILEKKQLEKELSLAIDIAKSSLKEKIRHTQEAINTAQSLDITNPVSLSDLSNSKGKGIAVKLNSNQEPLYLLGTRLLAAELELAVSREPYIQDARIIELESKIKHLKQNPEAQLLKERSSDIAFTPELQEIANRIHATQAETFPNISLKFALADAVPDSRPLTAPPFLIIMLSVILGVILGLLICLAKISYKKALIARTYRT